MRQCLIDPKGGCPCETAARSILALSDNAKFVEGMREAAKIAKEYSGLYRIDGKNVAHHILSRADAIEKERG